MAMKEKTEPRLIDVSELVLAEPFFQIDLLEEAMTTGHC